RRRTSAPAPSSSSAPSSPPRSRGSTSASMPGNGRRDHAGEMSDLSGAAPDLGSYSPAAAIDRGAVVDLGLAGATAVVVGGTQGMGRAAAECFAADGAKVSVVARTQ